MYEFRWVYRYGKAENGWILITHKEGLPHWKVLQSCERIEDGLEPAIIAGFETLVPKYVWSEWKDIPFGGVDE